MGGLKPRVAAHEYCLEWQLDERENGREGGSGGGGGRERDHQLLG